MRKYVTAAGARALREALKKLGKGKSNDYLMIKKRGTVIKVRNETEAKAALKALEVFESLPDTDSLSIREKNRILNQACRSYAGMAAREKEYQ